jgi:hypothetical protein
VEELDLEGLSDEPRLLLAPDLLRTVGTDECAEQVSEAIERA